MSKERDYTDPFLFFSDGIEQILFFFLGGVMGFLGIIISNSHDDNP